MAKQYNLWTNRVIGGESVNPTLQRQYLYSEVMNWAAFKNATAYLELFGNKDAGTDVVLTFEGTNSPDSSNCVWTTISHTGTNELTGVDNMPKRTKFTLDDIGYPYVRARIQIKQGAWWLFEFSASVICHE